LDVNVLGIALGLVAGVAAGVVHFGGLWLTIRRLPSARRPHLLMLASFAARTVLVVAVMLAMAYIDWQAVVAAFAALILARAVLVRKLAPRADGVRTE
jgi:F1F0 ATPase subunit 2